MSSVLQGANIFAFGQALGYLSPLGPRHRLAVPRLFRRALIKIGALLFLSNLASVFDIWFHGSSSAVSRFEQSQLPLSTATQFGKQINETRCAYYASDPTEKTDPQNPDMNLLCGLYTVDAGGDLESVPEELRTRSNSSEVNSVVFTNDQHAILAPAILSPDTTYTATTVGVQSYCERCAYSWTHVVETDGCCLVSITARCVNPSNRSQASWTFGTPWFDCTGNPPVMVNNSILEAGDYGDIFGVVDATGSITYSASEQAYMAANTKYVRPRTVSGQHFSRFTLQQSL